MSVVIERTTVSLWAIRAVFGSNSLKWTPGIEVEMDPKGPRISNGAAGFGSKVSCCGGPPTRKISRHDFALPKEVGSNPPLNPEVAVPAPARARSNRDNDTPKTPRLPACNQSRRDWSVPAAQGPGHLEAGPSNGEFGIGIGMGTRVGLGGEGSPFDVPAQ